MGWTYMEMPREGTTEWFKRQLTWESDDGTKRRVLETAIVARTEAYAAVETVRPNGEREVWAAVFLLNYVPRAKDGFTFGYKDMDETVGPNADNCPARILDLLTPTESQYANDWRNRCRARLERRIANKVSDGDVIKLETPLNYSGYGEADTFKVRMQGRKVYFMALDSETLDPRFLCRISGWRDRAFSRVEPGNDPAAPAM